MSTALSVVIPTLNAASELADTLAALSEATSFQPEVVVADGGSTDATIALAQQRGVRVVSAIGGRGAQLATGAAAATAASATFPSSKPVPENEPADQQHEETDADSNLAPARQGCRVGDPVS